MSTMSRRQFAELKRLHKEAEEAGNETFFFYGNEMVTNYAKYLIESLEPRFRDSKEVDDGRS